VPQTAVARPAVVVSASRPALIVLSAKNAERLKEQAGQLVAALERDALGDGDLADVAYTLQVGREAMESRLALTASSMAELVAKLRGYLAGETGIEALYRGETRREKETLGLFAAEDMASIVDGWVEQGKYGKLLELWVKGLSFDWERLYGEARPRRISLPTYPFAKERYWVEVPDELPQNVIPLRPRTNGFDELAYAKLLDQVVANTVSVAAAINETEKLLSPSSEG